MILHRQKQLVHVCQSQFCTARQMLAQGVKLSGCDLVAIKTGPCSMECAHVLNECVSGGRRYSNCFRGMPGG